MRCFLLLTCALFLCLASSEYLITEIESDEKEDVDIREVRAQDSVASPMFQSEAIDRVSETLHGDESPRSAGVGIFSDDSLSYSPSGSPTSVTASPVITASESEAPTIQSTPVPTEVEKKKGKETEKGKGKEKGKGGKYKRGKEPKHHRGKGHVHKKDETEGMHEGSSTTSNRAEDPSVGISAMGGQSSDSAVLTAPRQHVRDAESASASEDTPKMYILPSSPEERLKRPDLLKRISTYLTSIWRRQGGPNA